MSTLEDRLRKRAEELDQHLQTAEAEAARREAEESKRIIQRVRRVGQEYVKRTSVLIAATRKPVYHDLRYSATGREFTLEVGRLAALQASLESDAWHVAIRNRFANVFRHTYESDDLFLGARDELLEPLVINALEALLSGKEQPADERGRRVSRR